MPGSGAFEAVCRTGRNVLLVVALLSAGACSRRGPESLALAASTSFHPAAVRLADEFMASRPGCRISVQGVDSATALQAVLSGVADVGFADWTEPPPALSNLTVFPVADDAIAVVVNPANAVSNITMGQLRGILSGGIRSWSAVGGADHAINVTVREAGSGTRASVEALLGVAAVSADAVVQDTSGALMESVGSDGNAIGYVSFGRLDARARALSVDGVPCDEASVRAGRYPLVRPVRLMLPRSPKALAGEFAGFVAGGRGCTLIAESGLIQRSDR